MLRRIKNRAIAKVLTRYPSFSRVFIEGQGPREPLESRDIPWTRPTKPLSDSKIALVTTAGVHHRWQDPFDMDDPEGDPTFRVINAEEPPGTLMITHDYYDHADADRDLNVVFPLDRLRELVAEGLLGGVAKRHYGFMGHIVGGKIETLVEKTAPEVAAILRADGVDAVVLTPG